MRGGKRSWRGQEIGGEGIGLGEGWKKRLGGGESCCCRRKGGPVAIVPESHRKCQQLLGERLGQHHQDIGAWRW